MGFAAEVNRDVVSQHRALFRELDKDVQKVTRREIKSEVSNVAGNMGDWIAARQPLPPLSGMQYGTQWKWNAPNVKASVRLSAGPSKPLAYIYAKADGKGKMFAITELAGTRSDGYTARGQHMIETLAERFPLVKGRGGRFLFKSFLIFRPDLHDAVFKGLNVLSRAVNSKLSYGGK